MNENTVILNKEQEQAKNMIVKWFTNQDNKKQCFILTGYAGTGKTFLIQYVTTNILKLNINDVAYVAPTGKAASVLIQRGVYDATTIHRLIYNRVEVIYKTRINNKIIKSKRTEFVKKPTIKNYKLIVLDEASMVEKKVMSDLLSFGIPIICCGDIGQLPAIGANSNILEKPDINLTEVVRQESGNSIITLATYARNNMTLRDGNYGNVIVTNRNALTNSQYKNILLSADQILCGRNVTRRKLNQEIKEYLGYDTKKVNNGEKIICLLNNWDTYLDIDQKYSLVNGIIGNVTNINSVESTDPFLGKLDFKPEFLDEECQDLIYDASIFSNSEFKYDFHTQVYLMEDGSYQVKVPFASKKDDETQQEFSARIRSLALSKRDAICTEQLNFFDSAYAISVHKSQGSEWNNVLLFDESFCFNEPSKWLYTGITRAKKNLVIIK